jgi:nuclease S1
MLSGLGPRRDRRSWIVTGLTLLVALQTAAPAWAWGRLGHRVISRIAEKSLTSKAKAAIAELLEPGESLAGASTWADENRRKLPKTAPWHFVDVPLDEPRYAARFSGDDPAKGCIVDKIRQFRATLKDPSRSVEDRRFALRFLIHLIQDLHMPLHVGDNHDKGAIKPRLIRTTQGRPDGRPCASSALLCGPAGRVVKESDSRWLALGFA